MQKVINNIIINYEEEACNYIDDVINYLTSKVDDIYLFFGLNLKNNVNITIVPTKQQLDSTYWNNPDMEPLPWIVGFTNVHNEILDIFLLSFNDYKNTLHKYATLVDYKKTSVHEFVHVVHTVLCNGNYPQNYIWEGVATYLSKQYPNTEKVTSSKEDILSCSCDFNQLASLFEIILNNYSHDDVIKILKNEIDGIKLLDDLLAICNKVL